VSAPAGPPPFEPPLDTLPPDAPATVEDVRASRRWTWVALAWAVAASVIAVLALLDASSKPEPKLPPDATPKVEQLRTETNDRLTAFERRLQQLATQDDVKKLEKRLVKAEDEATAAKDAADKAATADDLKTLQTKVDDLDQRVSDLEKNQQSQPATP
jgi:septal ring factor EnvC (AmiA/AmiB activator)